MSNSLDLLPDVTQEQDPDSKRHHDTLVYVQNLARLICPPGQKESGIVWWNRLCIRAGICEPGTVISEDLTWQQLLDVWEYIIFEGAAPRLLKARKWVERYYKKDV